MNPIVVYLIYAFIFLLDVIFCVISIKRERYISAIAFLILAFSMFNASNQSWSAI